MRRLTALAVAAAVAVLIAGGSVPANAAESTGEQDPLITAMLAEVPGGVVVDETRVVWPRLDMELEVQPERAAFAFAVGSCATGRICAYNAVSLAGSRLSFGTCGNHPIPSPFTARSVANARLSGSVQARNGSTVVATVYAGNWTNLGGAVNNLRCVL